MSPDALNCPCITDISEKRKKKSPQKKSLRKHKAIFFSLKTQFSDEYEQQLMLLNSCIVEFLLCYCTAEFLKK